MRAHAVSFALIAVLGSLPACSLFRKSDSATSSSAAAAESPPEESSAPPGVAPLEAPQWRTVEDASFIGLPEGCVLGRPVRKAALPGGTIRFSAPANASELVMAVDADGNGAVDRAGILDAEGHPSSSIPWLSVDAPPVVARSAPGLFAVRGEETHDGRRRALLWTPSGKARALVEGDHLDVVDFACDESACAVLTSLASTSASTGATVLVGDPRAPVSAWTRTDLVEEGEPWAPFSIVEVARGVALVALSGKGTLEVVRVEKGVASHIGEIPTPLGAYDVLPTKGPVALAPSESIDDECKKDGFIVRLVGVSGHSSDIDVQVPPETVVARKLDTGFIVGWLSPTRCRIRTRQMVRAFMIGPDGAPRTSTMAVTEADGFAMSTHGAELDLWLATRTELIWAKATCRVPDGRAH